MLFQKYELLVQRLHSKCMSLFLTIMGKLLKQEVYAALAAKELPGTRIALYNQILSRARSFNEASLQTAHKEVST